MNMSRDLHTEFMISCRGGCRGSRGTVSGESHSSTFVKKRSSNLQKKRRAVGPRGTRTMLSVTEEKKEKKKGNQKRELGLKESLYLSEKGNMEGCNNM